MAFLHTYLPHPGYFSLGPNIFSYCRCFSIIIYVVFCADYSCSHTVVVAVVVVAVQMYCCGCHSCSCFGCSCCLQLLWLLQFMWLLVVVLRLYIHFNHVIIIIYLDGLHVFIVTKAPACSLTQVRFELSGFRFTVE